ncbi:hypothetical protein [Teredinibacter franksiae]|uniref:hypothetical protein n=1 Tax=Teredinibacter franksiae TaxID=2761453 RepID=UPI00162996D6|nr:hypothetical protein [Teredinibacter franksiae]
MFPKQFLSSLGLLIFLAVTVSGCSVHEPSSANINASIFGSPELQQRYDLGKPIVLFSYSEDISATEAYADWAAYLNEFKQEQGDGFLFIRVVKADFNIQLGDEDEFTLFVKKGYPNYLYQGLIVEPQVYGAVAKRYSDTALSGMDRAFMPEEVD